MTENKNRIARFTNSQIYKLMTNGKGVHGFGAAAITYIEEKNLEIKLGRSIKTETYAKDMAWGNFLEQYVFHLLPFGYEWTGTKTDSHPIINCWSGSSDFKFTGGIAELKCYQPKNFAQYTDALLSKDIQLIKKDFPEEYWQMVGNAIINGVDIAEAITFMPYRSQLPELREMAENYDGPDQWKYRFIAEGEDCDLAYLPDGGYYKNLNSFQFEVPKEDKEALTERVLLAEKLLIKLPSVLIATNDPQTGAIIIEK